MSLNTVSGSNIRVREVNVLSKEISARILLLFLTVEQQYFNVTSSCQGAIILSWVNISTYVLL